MGKSMLQGIIESSTAIGEQLVELYSKAVCGQGKRQSTEALLKPLLYCLAVHMPKAAPWETLSGTLHCGGNRLH